jgi:signal transduction histidine kinase
MPHLGRPSNESGDSETSDIASNISNEGVPGRTEVIAESKKIMELTLNEFQRAQRTYDTCGDRNMPVSAITIEPVWKCAVEMMRRGVKSRCITEVTKDNISYCKEIGKEAELRHLDRVKGSFTVVDGSRCMIHPEIKEGKPPTVIIYSTSRSIVEMQQYIFETFWNEAIPAEDRIREIEQGREHETIDTLRDPREMLRLAQNLVRSAKYEILVIFSTVNALLRQEKAGTLELLLNAANARGVRIRILSPFDGRAFEVVERLRDKSLNKIKVRIIDSEMQTRVSFLLVDGRYAFSVEVKDDSRETAVEAMGLATYSNSNATVSSYVAIFESLWHQAEVYEQLKLYNEMQREFINIAAHELRTPIQPILGLSGILFEESKASGDRRQHILEIINRNANRLYKLTESLLDVARIENQSLNLNKEAFDIVDMVKHAIADLETSAATNKNAKLLLVFQERDPVFVNADKERLTQVVNNLVNNALKFTKEGAVAIKVQRDLNRPDPVAVVSVRDSGSGIDPEIMPRLFTKFASKSEKGTGLGLFISKGIVEAHGGKIWAKNNNDDNNNDHEKDRGATFTFSLPLCCERGSLKQVRN